VSRTWREFSVTGRRQKKRRAAEANSGRRPHRVVTRIRTAQQRGPKNGRRLADPRGTLMPVRSAGVERADRTGGPMLRCAMRDVIHAERPAASERHRNCGGGLRPVGLNKLHRAPCDRLGCGLP